MSRVLCRGFVPERYESGFRDHPNARGHSTKLLLKRDYIGMKEKEGQEIHQMSSGPLERAGP